MSDVNNRHFTACTVHTFKGLARPSPRKTVHTEQHCPTDLKHRLRNSLLLRTCDDVLY